MEVLDQISFHKQTLWQQGENDSQLKFNLMLLTYAEYLTNYQLSSQNHNKLLQNHQINLTS